MTIQLLTTRPLLMHRLLRIGGVAVIACVIIALFLSSGRVVNDHWLKKATTAELRAEATAHPGDEEVNLVLNRHLNDEGKYEQAFQLMTQLTARIPGSARCWDHYARDAAQTNRFLEAFNGYQQEIRCDHRAANAHAALGSMLIEAGLVSEGLSEIDSATRIDPHARIDVKVEAEGLDAKGRLDEEWKLLTDTLNASIMHHQELWAPLGKLAVKLGKCDDAGYMMLDRIKKSDMYGVVSVRAPLVRMLLARSHSAETLDEAYVIAKECATHVSAEAQAPLGEVLLLKGDLNGARRVLEAGLKMDIPLTNAKDPDCVRMLAEIAEAQGRTADAGKLRAELPPTFVESAQLAALRQAAKASRENIPAQIAYASALERATQFGPAVEVCQGVLGINPNERAAIELKERCRDEALRKLDASVKSAALTQVPLTDLRALHAPK